MYEYYRQIASSLTSSQSNINILPFAIAFLKELNSRTIIEYFLNLAYVNMMLEREFINYICCGPMATPMWNLVRIVLNPQIASRICRTRFRFR